MYGIKQMPKKYFSAWLNKENVTYQGIWSSVKQILLNSNMSIQAFLDIILRYEMCVISTHIHTCTHDIYCLTVV